MPEKASTVEFPVLTRELATGGADHHARTITLPVHLRLRHGVRKPHNWFQLIRFGAVGASGYVVNLAVFAFCVHVVGIDYRVSAVIAWIVSVLNNFWLNRHWTFRAKQAHPVRQGIRFFAVSLVTFGFTYLVLIGLVEGAGLTKVMAQAIAVAAGTPLNFVGQKLWSFRL
jgi:dolichol-phosphate mannosyltransferase